MSPPGRPEEAEALRGWEEDRKYEQCGRWKERQRGSGASYKGTVNLAAGGGSRVQGRGRK